MSRESVDVEYLSLAGDLRRDVAPRSLLTPGDGSSELVILAAQVQRVDVVAGTAMGLRMARHLREHPSGRVVIMPPASLWFCRAVRRVDRATSRQGHHHGVPGSSGTSSLRARSCDSDP